MSEILDLRNMNVLLQSEDAFPRRGAFALDAKNIYVIRSIGEHDEISAYNPETQEFKTLFQFDFGSIVNFQLIYD